MRRVAIVACILLAAIAPTTPGAHQPLGLVCQVEGTEIIAYFDTQGMNPNGVRVDCPNNNETHGGHTQ